MPVCLKTVQSPSTVDGDGNSVPGAIWLALDPVQSNLAACAYVVQTGEEASTSSFVLSAEDGAIFSAGLISCWLIAFGIRSIIHVIRGSTE